MAGPQAQGQVGERELGLLQPRVANSGRGGALVYGGRREEERHSACL